MRLECTGKGLEFRRAVNDGVGRDQLIAGLGVWLAVVGGVALVGGSALQVGIAAVVGAVLGHIPAVVPRSGEVRFAVDDRAILWELHGPSGVREQRSVPLARVADALVMPHEGQGWGLELHLRGDDGRVQLWTPLLPLPSADEAKRAASWIRQRALGRGHQGHAS